jgi:hypothetical protein
VLSSFIKVGIVVEDDRVLADQAAAPTEVLVNASQVVRNTRPLSACTLTTSYLGIQAHVRA